MTLQDLIRTQKRVQYLELAEMLNLTQKYIEIQQSSSMKIPTTTHGILNLEVHLTWPQILSCLKHMRV